MCPFQYEISVNVIYTVIVSVFHQSSTEARCRLERENKQCLDLELTGTNKFHYFTKGKYHSKNRTPFHSDYEITIIRINRVIRI